MSANDPSLPAETIAQRVKQRKPPISAVVMANIFHGKLMPLPLLEGRQKCEQKRSSILPPKRRPERPKLYPMTQDRVNINSYLPMELLREVFLYCIEVNQMKSGQLASICRHWWSVITSIASLWSTLRVGTCTETERVATWLQRAYPKKVVIDIERDYQSQSEALAFSALQNSLTSTDQWHELTISSFPAENLASQLGIQVAIPMNGLKILHMAAGCMHSPSLTHMLNLIPTEAPLSELRLNPPFASTHFLQPPLVPCFEESHSAYCQWQRY